MYTPNRLPYLLALRVLVPILVLGAACVVQGQNMQTNVIPSAVGPLDTTGHQDRLIQKFNQAFGAQLMSNSNLWEEDGDKVGKRLGWDKDSVSSFRPHDSQSLLYNPENKSVNCLGAHAYSSALYTRQGKPDYLSIVFANNGDSTNPSDAIPQDSRTLHDLLTSLLGAPTTSTYGGSAQIPVERWNWNTTSILLTKAPSYAGIIICPTKFADDQGVRQVTITDEVRKRLVKNVVRSTNGDVVIQNIPFVDQGRKGYCLPATWERYLRYIDVPADIYLIAVVVHTAPDGATSGGQKMRDWMQAFLNGYGIHVTHINQEMSIANLSPYIDRGMPVVWMCTLYGGHSRLIVGYNAATQSLAVSDTFDGGTYQWISIQTANDISLNGMAILE